MMEAPNGYSIAIPAYGRPVEFEELLVSINDSKLTFDEVIICEDCSKQRPEINIIAKKWAEIFVAKNCKFTYIENEINLGYDGNIRKLIQQASFKWVVLMGNDDILLPNGLSILTEFCNRLPDTAMVSRPFLRFNKSIHQPVGTSRFFAGEKIISKETTPPNFIFRVCGFVGGLVINKNWADKFHTTKYDEALYYQIFLGCHAYCTNGIGYLAEPTVGARIDNMPLFGEAGAKHHIPGSYSPKGRASMWAGVLQMASDVGKEYQIDLHTGIKHELAVQQAFHVFEMNAVANKTVLKELKSELEKLDLFNNWVPKLLYRINYLFGYRSKLFYALVRKVVQ